MSEFERWLRENPPWRPPADLAGRARAAAAGGVIWRRIAVAAAAAIALHIAAAGGAEIAVRAALGPGAGGGVAARQVAVAAVALQKLQAVMALGAFDAPEVDQQGAPERRGEGALRAGARLACCKAANRRAAAVGGNPVAGRSAARLLIANAPGGAEAAGRDLRGAGAADGGGWHGGALA